MFHHRSCPRDRWKILLPSRYNLTFYLPSIFRPLYHLRKWLQYSVQIRQTMWVTIGLVSDVHYHFLKSKNDLNKVCRAWRVMKLWYSSFLQLKTFQVSKYGLKLSLLKNSNFEFSNLISWKKTKNNILSW
jgi:hypothetical protein